MASIEEIELDEETVATEPTGTGEPLDPDQLKRAADMASTDAETRKVVEAALFSAGGPISDREIADKTGIGLDDVQAALEDLRTVYGDDGTALEVARAGEKYAMQIRADLTETTRDLAPMEIPKHLLRTLALIAYHQPIKQSELVDMIGSKTYDHVRELEDREMIDATPDGLTKELTTSDTFPEYFGIDATEPDEIRDWMASKVGLGEAEAEPATAKAEPSGGGVLGALLG